MSDVSFSLAIPHCLWTPERVESMARLTRGLNFYENDGDAYVRNESEREWWKP